MFILTKLQLYRPVDKANSHLSFPSEYRIHLHKTMISYIQMFSLGSEVCTMRVMQEVQDFYTRHPRYILGLIILE